MKNILIVGAGKGIGLAIAEQLSQSHHVTAITKSKSESLEHTGASVVYGNAASQELWDSIALPDVLDGLVYCPGSINLKPFQRLGVNDFLADFEQNLLGAVRAIQQCLHNLKRSNAASVVLFSSVAAKVGMPFHSSIAASKAGIEGLVRSLAAEYAGSRVRFNAVAPSLTDTPLSSFLTNTSEKKEAAIKRHPLQAIGNPAEVASLACFLLSENASWITGQVIGLDGGLSTLK